LKPFTQKGFKDLKGNHLEKMKTIESQILTLTTELNMHKGAIQVYEQMGNVARAVESGSVVESLKDSTWVK
jgi:hypothetical protein